MRTVPGAPPARPRAAFDARARLIAQLHDRLQWDGLPRLTMVIILAFAGIAALAASFGLLAAGLTAMGWRYFFAALAGYAAFFAGVRLWIAVRRGLDPPDSPAGIDPYLDVGTSPVGEAFGGGRSGGAGGGAHWQGAGDGPNGGASSFAEGLDLDELWTVVLAGVAVIAGLAVVGYVIYIAPLLLAEVALDAALISTAYRRLRAEDAGHWTGGVLRRTAVPAAVLAVFVGTAGGLVQYLMPQADSIGDVVRWLLAG